MKIGDLQDPPDSDHNLLVGGEAFHAVGMIAHKLGYLFNKPSGYDKGIDAEIEITRKAYQIYAENHGSKDLPEWYFETKDFKYPFIGLQIKGRSSIRSNKNGDFILRVTKANLKYWKNYGRPVIIILYTNENFYWARVDNLESVNIKINKVFNYLSLYEFIVIIKQYYKEIARINETEKKEEENLYGRYAKVIRQIENNAVLAEEIQKGAFNSSFLSKLAISNYSLLKKPTSVSRRTVLIGLVGLGTAVSGFTLLTHSFYNVPIGTTLYIYRGHPRIVTSVAWSPNGKLVASGSDDTTVQVWSPSTGNKIFTYDGHLDAINSIAWSPSGEYIASCSMDKTTQVWVPTTGWSVAYYNKYIDPMRVVACSPNSEYIAGAGGNEWTASDTAVHVWNTTTGKLTFTYLGHTDRVTGLAWSPNSNRIASTSFDGTLQVWDAFSGKNSAGYHEDFSSQTSVGWAPDGKYIASSNAIGEVKIRDITGKVIFTRQAQGGVDAIAWSPNGRHIALASNDFTVEIWDATGTHIFTYQGHSQQVTGVAWSPDSTRIASSSYDATVQIWTAT